MHSIHPKGVARDVRNQDSFSAEHHVLSNALLPGRFRGRGVRLFIHAPLDEGIESILLLLYAMCPGACKTAPGFLLPGEGNQARKNQKKKGDYDHE